MDIRNIAVIAHVDHGKTTLVDELLKQSGTLKEKDDVGRVMDSNDLEKERGITILAKNTAIVYKDVKINIIDTPGHADFGGEVERVLKMVDNVLLLVDASEGVMPQTKFVVKKALELGHKPIVVLNKIDKIGADVDKATDELFDLFDALGATDEQLDFTTVLAIAKQGIAKLKIDDESDNIIPLLDTILELTPKPKGSSENNLQAQAFNLSWDNFVGKMAIVRVFNGTFKLGDNLTLVQADGKQITKRVSKLIGFIGVERTEIEQANFGDIVAIAGFDEVDVGDSFCAGDEIIPLEPLALEEPTLSVTFAVNDSPLAGQEGKFVTSNKIKERLEDEMKTNIAMSYEQGDEGNFTVRGRGELQIGILAENMRREGFEFSISRPQVIIKEIDGIKSEPYEALVIDVPTEYSGGVIQSLGEKKGIVQNMITLPGDVTRLELEIPSKSLIGYRSEFLTQTKGEGVMSFSFLEYRPFSGSLNSRANGALISTENGETSGYSLFSIQERGDLFVGPGEKVYCGMVIGEHSRANDLDVNPIKGKQLSNVRSSGADDAIKLVPPRELNLDKALEWIDNDEIVEVTPISIRIRKIELDANKRKRAAKKNK